MKDAMLLRPNVGWSSDVVVVVVVGFQISDRCMPEMEGVLLHVAWCVISVLPRQPMDGGGTKNEDVNEAIDSVTDQGFTTERDPRRDFLDPPRTAPRRRGTHRDNDHCGHYYSIRIVTRSSLLFDLRSSFTSPTPVDETPLLPHQTQQRRTKGLSTVLIVPIEIIFLAEKLS